jgi:hypothetical protein
LNSDLAEYFSEAQPASCSILYEEDGINILQNIYDSVSIGVSIGETGERGEK